MYPSITHLSATIKYGFNQAKEFKNDDFISNLIKSLAEAVNSTPLETKIKRLSPQGIIAYALLIESHISLHVWEEFFYAALDIATSAKTEEPITRIEKVLRETFPESELTVSLHS